MALLPAHKTLPEGPLLGLMPSLLNSAAVNLLTVRKFGPSAEGIERPRDSRRFVCQGSVYVVCCSPRQKGALSEVLKPPLVFLNAVRQLCSRCSKQRYESRSDVGLLDISVENFVLC
jgi:hypothetical protein